MGTILRLFVTFALLASFALGADEAKLELRGKVKYGASRVRFLRVAIFRVESPFTATTLTDPGGDFKFRGLAPGTYTLSVLRRGLGEVRRSVVLSPRLADKKGVVRIEIPFSPGDAAKSGTGGTVSRNQLTVPGRATLKYAEAERRLNKQDVEGARKSLLEAVKIAPQYTAAWNFLGVLDYQARNWDRAEEYFRHALDLEREAFEPTVNLGGLLLAKGQPKVALGFNQKATELRPRDALANVQLGINYFDLGRFDDALPHLDTAKEVDPSHSSQPQLYLSRIYERRGERDAAARELQDLLERRPDSPIADQLRRRMRRLDAQTQARPQ